MIFIRCRRTRTCDTLRRPASVYAGTNRHRAVSTIKVMLPLLDTIRLVSTLNVSLVICEYRFLLQNLYARWSCVAMAPSSILHFWMC